MDRLVLGGILGQQDRHRIALKGVRSSLGFAVWEGDIHNLGLGLL